MIGLTFTLFIFVYTCASSSVYAKTLRDMPTENGTIAEPDEEELADSPYLSQDALVAQDTLSEPTAPLVQSLTMAQASPSILYQDVDYDTRYLSAIPCLLDSPITARAVPILWRLLLLIFLQRQAVLPKLLFLVMP